MKIQNLVLEDRLSAAHAALVFWHDGICGAFSRGRHAAEAKKDSMVSAQYTITADDTIDSVKLVLSYDKDVLTYMSGSGGDNFSGNGGNGTVELSSKPGSDSASFEVKFKGNADADTTVTISSCVIESSGEQIDALTGENVSSEQTATDSEEEDEEMMATVQVL